MAKDSDAKVASVHVQDTGHYTALSGFANEVKEVTVTLSDGRVGVDRSDSVSAATERATNSAYRK